MRELNLWYSMGRCQGRTLAAGAKEGRGLRCTVQSWHDKNCWRSYNECEKNKKFSNTSFVCQLGKLLHFIRVNISTTISNHQFENLSYNYCALTLVVIVSRLIYLVRFAAASCLLDVSGDLVDRRK